MFFTCSGAGEGFIKASSCEKKKNTSELAIDKSNSAFCCLLTYDWRDDYTLDESFSECIAVSNTEYNEIEKYVKTAKNYIKEKYNEGFGSYVSYMKVNCNGNFLTTSFLSLILLLLF